MAGDVHRVRAVRERPVRHRVAVRGDQASARRVDVHVDGPGAEAAFRRATLSSTRRPSLRRTWPPRSHRDPPVHRADTAGAGRTTGQVFEPNSRRPGKPSPRRSSSRRESASFGRRSVSGRRVGRLRPDGQGRLARPWVRYRAHVIDSTGIGPPGVSAHLRATRDLGGRAAGARTAAREEAAQPPPLPPRGPLRFGDGHRRPMSRTPRQATRPFNEPQPTAAPT